MRQEILFRQKLLELKEKVFCQNSVKRIDGIMICDNPKYSGVGGHLFAIAADKSMEYGYEGVMVGYAANMDLVNHYCEVFKANHIAMLHPYQIAIYEKEAEELREVYDYEWTDEEV